MINSYRRLLLQSNYLSITKNTKAHEDHEEKIYILFFATASLRDKKYYQ